MNLFCILIFISYINVQGIDGILCEERNNHKNSCSECSVGYAIIEEITSLVNNGDSSILTPLEKSHMSNDCETISLCKLNLDTLRSHLARHFTEAQSDCFDLANLDDITAIVISDFKNNILDMMFRENMGKFFGKNGTTDLGFMRIMKGSDATSFEATFYHFVSNDKFKDT